MAEVERHIVLFQPADGVQPVQHRTLDLGELQPQAFGRERAAQFLQRGEAGHVDVVDRRHQQQHALRRADTFAVFSHPRQHLVAEAARIREHQALVDAQAHHLGLALHRVTLDVAVMLGARHAADTGHVRPRGALDQQRDGPDHPERERRADAPQQHRGRDSGHQHPFGTRIPPGVAVVAQREAAEHRDDDGRGQHRLGQMGQRPGQQQHGQRHETGDEHQAPATRRAGLVQQDAARKAAGHRHAAGHRRDQVGRRQAAQFGGGQQLLAAPLGEGLGHREAGHEAHQPDQRGGGQQAQPERRIQRRQADRHRQRGQRADLGHALCRRRQGRQRHRDNQQQQWRQPGQRPGAQAARQQQQPNGGGAPGRTERAHATVQRRAQQVR
mmetsp:Transcript_49007/g.115101  ORF Transcript_49007/g.115101 Transcript_49007/m.115101 type:complete len:384 (+) Transcript_49007:3151-4302(+)